MQTIDGIQYSCRALSQPARYLNSFNFQYLNLLDYALL